MVKGRITSSMDYNVRPAWFRAVNGAMRRGFLGRPITRLDKDELIIAARKLTGLRDFGPDFWEEPLERMIRSVNEEARLHQIGYFISKQRITSLLATRLRAESWFKKYPEILEQELYPVIVIIGLQRTGTTKLQRLLMADPDNRVLRSWEALSPVPFSEKRGDKKKRIRVARTSERALRFMAPGFFAIHPVEYNAPEEDILLLDSTFLSTTPEATMHVPSYSEWLETVDQSLAYAYGVKLMKLLQWQQPARRWVLKSPHHLEFLDIIEKEMGDIHYIWTHRDLSSCIPSFLSMVSHSRVIFSDDVRIEEVVNHWMRKTSFMLSKGISFRKIHENGSYFTDVYYNDLVSDAILEIHRIYERYGGIHNGFIDKFTRTEAENPQWKYGVHKYSLSDFGLSAERLNSMNREYLDFMEMQKSLVTEQLENRNEGSRGA